MELKVFQAWYWPSFRKIKNIPAKTRLFLTIGAANEDTENPHYFLFFSDNLHHKALGPFDV